MYDGISTRAIVVDAPSQRTRVIGLEFTAAGGFALVGPVVCETTDRDADFESFARDDARALLENCRAARGPAAKLLTAVRYCAARAARAAGCDPSVTAAVARIENARGHVRMKELAADIGRGERAFERAFRDRVGLAPKRFARIARFAHAHELLARADQSLAAVATRAGYYDQAHFNADFREHAGLSPTQYLTSLRYPDSRSIAEPDIV